MLTIEKPNGSPISNTVYPLTERLTGRELSAAVITGQQLAKVPEYWQDYSPDIFKESYLFRPNLFLVVDARGVVQNLAKVTLPAEDNLVHLDALYTGPWNLKSGQYFLTGGRRLSPTFDEMQRHYAVRGAGRAQIAGVIEWALRHTKETDDKNILVTVNPAPLAETFYERIRFETCLGRRKMELTRADAQEFLLDYQENPFFF